MKVFKFGGASINSFERIQNLATILEEYKNEKILIVISAMGKMTNALEKVTEAFYSGKKADALRLFEKIKQNHLTLLKYAVTQQWEAATNDLLNFFTEVEWLLHDKPVKEYNYYYDQVVCAGELLSSTIVSYFLNEEKILNKWIDVRDLLRTDNTFREAVIDWPVTRQKIEEKILPLFRETDLVITQGFIGSSNENESTTLGREGSDYTAAVFANILNAESVTIWKDVEGVMNADPKDLPGAVNIPELSYKEVIEMAYYGAQVIHPKTIKPLQNKNIPLHVKSFIERQLPGTVITGKNPHHLPPIIVYKRNQVLMTFESKDFSFVEGKPVNTLYEILEDIKIKPNLTQNAAISLYICMDDVAEKIEKVAMEASGIFDVQLEKNLTLLTIRHYTAEFINKLTENKTIVLQQKTANTIQVLMREI
ncbi:aspartate kinase [Ginsengibacter hankyongi]|uniref:Aspartokinase n=1 Tax=Ginsengibacter hankyongi TaxID=2607284 RepID=A0A5J5IMC2_9BACT|nr:aspartate kinase [Ginsengibacter hankyongi]KAA9041034.1 aspartate kinase [Ginsengibacter hankyongi]